MKNLILAMAAVTTALTGGCTSRSTAPVEANARAPQSIKVATWNLEHLAAENGVGCRPRTDADYTELRRHVDALGAHVIALQEVEDEAAARRVFPADRWSIVMSQRPRSTRSDPCREGSAQRIRTQDVGFAVRRGLRFRRNPDLHTLGLGDPDLRWGVDVTL